jgi:hypothetical protein
LLVQVCLTPCGERRSFVVVAGNYRPKARGKAREMFRTASGQTGRSAYVFEAAQVANAQRDLDERMERLCANVAAECADGELVGTFYPSPERQPGFTLTQDVARVCRAGGYTTRQAGFVAALLVSKPERPATRG